MEESVIESGKVEKKSTSVSVINVKIAKAIRRKREALNYNGVTIPRW